MPRIVDSDERRRRILTAAVEVFSIKGFSGAGLHQVARAAGISRPGIYTYYPDKDSLLDDLVTSICDEELILFEACLKDGGAVSERFENLARRLADSFHAMGPNGNIVIQLWGYRPARMAELLRKIRRLSEAAIRAGIREGDLPAGKPGVLALQLVAVLDGLLLQYLLEPGLFKRKEKLAQTLVAAVRTTLGRS